MLADEMVSLCRELGLEKIKVRGANVPSLTKID